MIRQMVSNLKSLVPIVKRIEAEEFKTVEEIIIHLHLFSKVEIGFDDKNHCYQNPLELEKRVDLLLRLAEYPRIREDYKNASALDKQVRRKAEQVLCQLLVEIKRSMGDMLINYLSLETVKKLSAFYGKLEYLPKHQVENLYEFFKWLNEGLETDLRFMPNWMRRQDEYDFLVNPLIATAISHLDVIDLIYYNLSQKKDILTKIDYYARGMFRVDNPCQEFDGPHYPSNFHYAHIIGDESLNRRPTSGLVIRAATVAYLIQENKKK